MDFTPEQQAVLSAQGDIKINAVAGSGKTTTLVEYARLQHPRSRILYLAFNRSVRMEAQKRFGERNLSNVDVQTAHSLAFRRIVVPQGFRVGKGYRIHDLIAMLNIRPAGRDLHAPYIIASHILKYAALFCNSDKRKVQEIDYCATLTDEGAAGAARRYHGPIEAGTRLFLAKMDRKEIEATHDFYLKKFQLSLPRLHYDIILFDEGQDASPVMLNVFLSQDARKVIVGDMHQQIYGWRQAVNALKQVDFTNYSLGTSFRFNEHVANLAVECLQWKRLLGEEVSVGINGVGANKKIKSRATIARTNLALLKRAIEAVEHDRAIKKIYFEGNLSSYTYAAEGASIYDVLNLYLGKKDRIRDPLIAAMGGFEELGDYAEKSEDMELRMLIDIVGAYGDKIPYLLKKLGSMHVEDDARDKADMIFSTLHRCKGMEYDSVSLAEDFITEERIRKLLAKEKEAPVDREKLSEEINLAYVAITRSRNFLDFPDAMFPLADKDLFRKKSVFRGFPKRRKRETRWPAENERREAANAYKPWSFEDDAALSKMFREGKTIEELAGRFKRNPRGIQARLKRLGLIDYT